MIVWFPLNVIRFGRLFPRFLQKWNQTHKKLCNNSSNKITKQQLDQVVEGVATFIRILACQIVLMNTSIQTFFLNSFDIYSYHYQGIEQLLQQQ